MASYCASQIPAQHVVSKGIDMSTTVKVAFFIEQVDFVDGGSYTADMERVKALAGEHLVTSRRDAGPKAAALALFRQLRRKPAQARGAAGHRSHHSQPVAQYCRCMEL